MHKIYPDIPRPSSLWGQLRACLLTHRSITGAKHVTCSSRHAFYDFKHENTRMRGEKTPKSETSPPCLPRRGRADPARVTLGAAGRGPAPAQAGAGGLSPASGRGRAGWAPGAVPGGFALTEGPSPGLQPTAPPPRTTTPSVPCAPHPFGFYGGSGARHAGSCSAARTWKRLMKASGHRKR